MADIRINALATTAASTASDDFIAVDGSANGTRKLNAFSPTFGGNLTVQGTGASSFSGPVTFASGGDNIKLTRTSFSSWQFGIGSVNSINGLHITDTTGSTTPISIAQGAPDASLKIAATTGNATFGGNLTVSGTTASIGGAASSWDLNAIQVLRGAIYGAGNETGYYNNANYSGGWKYTASAGASGYLQNGGTHQWYTAASGTAGNAITFAEAARITSAGNLGIGTTSPNAKLEIGLGSISGSEPNQYLRVNASTYNSALSANLDLLNWGNNFNNSLGWRISAINSAGVTTQRDLAFSSLVDAGSGTVGAATERMRLFGTGNLFIGASPVDSANGKLQLATHTTSAGGIGFGTDISLFRRGSNTFGFTGSAGSGIQLTCGTDPYLQGIAGSGYIRFFDAGSTVIASSGTTALTLDSSQNATFAGKLYSVSGTATTPAFSFTGDTGTGMYRSSAGIGALAASGSTAAFWANNVFAIYSGVPLRLGNAYTAGAPTATGYVTIQDSAGNTYKVLVGT